MKRLYIVPIIRVREVVVTHCTLLAASGDPSKKVVSSGDTDSRWAKKSSFDDDWETSQSISDEIHSK